jgi:mannitol-1-phosphate 5-dehydrogenase
VSLTGHRTFVGFGFGAIQAGLFLYEAFQSGGFARLVVGEVSQPVVDELRRSQGSFAVNIAHRDRVETARVGPVEIENPSVPSDLIRLVDAVAEAEEIATAVPSVNFYKNDGPGSIHQILAAGLRKKVRLGGPRAVVYAAENNNHAAEILEAAVLEAIPLAERAQVGDRVRFLDTVIGKMSGVVSGAGEGEARHLETVTHGSARIFLVESFSRILISQINFSPARHEAAFERGISAFVEKQDLLPFEEAKLYGHNATHALAAYLGRLRGYPYIADVRRDSGLFDFIRDAFLKESGEALIRAHAGVDPLFTSRGFEEYALDLIERMTNPYLLDSVERVGRDPQRKLGWDDRMVGTMRLALRQGVTPNRFAVGAAAALAALAPSYLDENLSAASKLEPIWGRHIVETSEAEQVLRLIEDARPRLARWRDLGFRQPPF